ncbi:class I adenylate-forming enzyme family protein [Ornithinimicrobium murale]|uniref:class I adenylate-forming enzyme family protein n=1 Tax=Ornithinimicrobium murale TaxID=1050153 RepID=UPI000E0D7E34|nr:class I adenylate-forming enzyme family protein [Ornithinimicrobium murale]
MTRSSGAPKPSPSESEIVQLLLRRATENPLGSAVLSQAGRLTWGELHQRAEQVSKAIDVAAARSGPVLLVGSNSVGYLVAFYGIRMSGRLVVPAAAATPTAQLNRMADFVGVDLAVVVLDEDGAMQRASECETVVAAVLHLTREGQVAHVCRAGSQTRTQVPVPAQAALVGFTSGSTGQPKAVVHAEASLMHGARCYYRDVMHGRPDPIMATLPLSHAGAVTVTMLTALVAGSPLVALDRFSAESFEASAALAPAQVVMLVPTMVELIDRANLRLQSESRPRVVVISGAPIHAGVVERAHEVTGAEVRAGLGMSECPGTVLLSPEGMDLPSLTQILGAASKGYAATTRPLSSKDRDSPLELLVQADVPALGYLLENGEMSSIGDNEGWISSGDLVYPTRDGVYRLRGRIKDVYIRGGFNVFPAEVEAVLLRYPGVTQGVVVGVPDPVLGERGHAWLRADDPATFDVESLRRFLTEQLPMYKNPDEISVVKELPTNSTGKIDRRVLAEAAVSRALGVTL